MRGVTVGIKDRQKLGGYVNAWPEYIRSRNSEVLGESTVSVDTNALCVGAKV